MNAIPGIVAPEYPPVPRARADAWVRVSEIAPLAPLWVRQMVVRMLVDRELRSDALLIFADALDDAGHAAIAEDEPTLAAQLRELAEMPRALAPFRARQETGRCP